VRVVGIIREISLISLGYREILTVGIHIMSRIMLTTRAAEHALSVSGSNASIAFFFYSGRIIAVTKLVGQA